MARQDYVSFDFQNFNEKGLKKVITALEKNDLKVTAVDADNKARRQSGVQTKKAALTLADGQVLTLQATSEGAIFQIRLNSRILPVRNVNNLSKAIAEIADKIKGNSPQFQRAMRRKAKVDQTVAKDTVARTTAKARLAVYQEQAKELQEQVQVLETRKSELVGQVSKQDATISTLQAQISEAREENERLQSELAGLEAA